MSYATDRVQLFDRDMSPLRELAPNEVFSRKRTEEINGEHELVITTTRKLEEGWRALTVDGMGKWREWVVTEIDEDHASGKTAMGTYRFVWSLQYDLTYSYAHTHAEIGYGDMPKTASAVAAVVLEGVSDWTVGSCDAGSVPSGSGAVMIYESAWSRLTKAVECLGCEVDAEIEVSNLYGVTARKLRLVAHVGNEEAVRRFDWGYDLTDIKRTPDPGPYYCRVVPLGKGESEYADDDETTFEWPIDITEETGDVNIYYLEDAESAQTFRIKKSDGTYYYPTIAVQYDEDDPELLLYAAQDDLHNHTRPGVTYEASVVQFAQAGMNVHGVQLGDEVQCVDTGFNEEAALRVQGRVIKIEVDELSPETSTQLTIGQLRNDMMSVISSLDATFDELAHQNSDIREALVDMTTSRYIDELLRRINTEINATGGYSYFVPGEGIITYDTAVSDPLVGSEATKVVQIKGGSIRIANAKNSGFSGIDDWDWKTVFTSGHISAELVTAAQLTAGYIGNASNSSFWNLDDGEFQLRYSEFDNQHVDYRYMRTMYVGKVLDADTTQAWYLVGHTLQNPTDTKALYGTKIAVSKQNLNNSSSQELSYLGLFVYGSENQGNRNSIGSSHDLYVLSNLKRENGSYGSLLGMSQRGIDLSSNSSYAISLYNYGITINGANVDSKVSRVSLDDTGLGINTRTTFTNTHSATFNGPTTFNGTATFKSVTAFDNGVDTKYGVDIGTSSVDATIGLRCYGAARFYGTMSCSGTVASNIKSRLVETEDYGNRLLFCYETPTPMFGDIGSAVIDDDGEAIVSIDDVFAETARTDFAYQVFLQKCGSGDLWVQEKHQSYFVVHGTPGLAFDWEIKARQVDNENIRLEDYDRYMSQEDEPRDAINSLPDIIDDEIEYAQLVAQATESSYDSYVDTMEQIYDNERIAA